MFNAMLFTMAKLWKQAQFSTTEEMIKKMWYYIAWIFFSHTEE
jgi:hypothetical protein